jgi:hypothetical protein
MTSPQQAEDDLDLLLDIGLNKFGMVIDDKLVEKIFPDITIQNISDPNFTIDFVNNIFVDNIQKIVDGVVVVGEQGSGEKLTENYLYRYSELAWAPALKKPHLAGGIIANPDKVVRLSMSFDEFLSMSKEQFFSITNCYNIVGNST